LEKDKRETFHESIKRSIKTNLAICMPAKIRAENNGIQFFTKGVSELRIPNVEKKLLCRSCWRQFQNPL